MKRAGYSAAFSAAITSVSATIGGIIPPSIGMIILATVASLSVGALFSGGIIPGILIGMALMVITWFIARRRNYERSDEPWNLQRIWHSFLGCALALSIPLVLVGSIVGGIASPVEAGAITAITSFILGLFVYRSITADILMGAITRAFKTAAAVFIIHRLGRSIQLAAHAVGNAEVRPGLHAGIHGSAFHVRRHADPAHPARRHDHGRRRQHHRCRSGAHPGERGRRLPGSAGGVGGGRGLPDRTVTPPIGVAYFTGSSIARARLEIVAVEMVPYLIAEFGVLFLMMLISPLTMWLPRVFGFVE